MEKLNGRTYRSWDEAMADPELDLSKAWYVAPDPEPAANEQAAPDWSGWKTIEPIAEV